MIVVPVYAPDFLQQPIIQALRWARIVGDTVFLAGAAAFAWFMAGLWLGWSYGTTPVRERLAAQPTHA